MSKLKATIIDDETVELRCGNKWTRRARWGMVDCSHNACNCREIDSFLFPKKDMSMLEQYNAIRELAEKQAEPQPDYRVIEPGKLARVTCGEFEFCASPVGETDEEFLKRLTEKPKYEYTGSGTFRHPDGREIVIPPPDGEGWKIEWTEVLKVFDDSFIYRAYDAVHSLEANSAQKEILSIVNVEPCRCIEWTNWRREIKPPAPPEKYEVKYPLLAPMSTCVTETGNREATVKGWPKGGRPRKVIEE